MTTSQTSDTGTPDLESEEIQLPAVIERNEKTVRSGFWSKLTRVAASIPFAEDLVAAYYCTRDPETPTRVRAILLAALAYFVLPTDMIPDVLVGLGFTDDLTVLATAYALIQSHMTDEHWDKARETLDKIRRGETPTE